MKVLKDNIPQLGIKKLCHTWDNTILKLLLILICYGSSTLFMAYDSWFTVGDNYFVWNQGILVILISFLIVSTFAWESVILGPPRGFSLILQVILILPITIFIGRIIGPPSTDFSSTSILGEIFAVASSVSDVLGLSNLIPAWLKEIFLHPGLLVLLIFICIAFNQKKTSRRVGLIITALLIPFAMAIAYPPRPELPFYLGVIILFFGILLNYCPYDKELCFENALKKLKNIDDEAELRCSLRITAEAINTGRIYEEKIRHIVRRIYEGFGITDQNALFNAANIITSRLIDEHSILVYTKGREKYFEPDYLLWRSENILDEISIWPRKIIIGGIAVIWVLLPIDLIPDATPVIGVVDDAVILLLGANQLFTKVRPPTK